jgi:hypothetical protein
MPLVDLANIKAMLQQTATSQEEAELLANRHAKGGDVIGINSDDSVKAREVGEC